jgi:hypothetical protein
MIVGPTVSSVSVGSGKPARCTSLAKMYCSIGVRPWPPNSTGQPMPSQPSRPSLRSAARNCGPPPSPPPVSSSTSAGVISSVK